MRKYVMVCLAFILLLHSFAGGIMPTASANTVESVVTEVPVNDEVLPEAPNEQAPDQDDQDDQSEQEVEQGNEVIEEPETPTEEAVDSELTDPELTEQDVIADAEEKVGFAITGVTLKDSKGEVIGDGRVDLSEAVEIIYNWDLADGHTFQAGSTYEFDIPKEFAIYTTIKNEPLRSDEGEIGTFNVDTSGHVIITFNDFVTAHSQISGHIGVKTNFSSQIISETSTVEIIFPIQESVFTKTIYFKPVGGTSLSKQGVAQNADTIQWSIDVNTALDTVDGAVLSDTLPDGLTLDTDSLKVHHLNIGIQGAKTLGEVATNYVVQAENGEFKIVFNEPGINSAYRVTYTTNVDPERDVTQFTNKAYLSGSKTAEASATVTIQKGALLDKAVERYDAPTQTIYWLIKYNFGQKKIAQGNAQLIDRFNGDQELLQDTVKVYKVDPTSSNNPDESQLVTNYVLTPVDNDNGKNGFDLKFNEDISDAYIIKYATKATGRVGSEGSNVINQVTTPTGDGESETKHAGQHLNNLIANKQDGEVNYDKKTVAWSITINEDNYGMNNVVIHDTFPTGGLRLIPSTVKVFDTSGDIVDESNYDLEVPGTLDELGKQGFTLRFKANYVVKSKHKVSYVTEFNNDWKHPTSDNKPASYEFPNEAQISWENKGHSESIVVKDSFWPDDLTRYNGAKSGWYDASTKTLTWAISANYNRKELKNAEIRDVLKQGQVYKENSLKVYHLKLLGWWNGTERGEPVDPSLYEVIAPSSSNNNTLTVKFKNTVTTPYWITFDTTLEKQVVDKVIHNEATLSADGYEATWNASVTVPYGGEYVAKSGVQNDDVIDWTIYINRGQSYVKNAVIYDTPTANQVVLADSFHLYNTIAKANGELAQGIELEKDKDYTLHFADDGSGKFEVKFTKPILNQAFILKYSSLINAENGEIISNKVSFEGDGITTGELTTNKEIIIRSSSGSGSGSGVVGNLEITKIDKSDPSKLLKGAVFELRDEKGKFATLRATTDVDGKAIFSRLLYGKYILKEITAPEGYVLDGTELSVVIDATIKKTGNVLALTISNSKKTDPKPPVTTPTDPGTPSNPSNPSTPTTPSTPSTPDPTLPSIEEPQNPIDNPEIVEIEEDELPLGGVEDPDSSNEEEPNTDDDPITKTSSVAVLPQTGEQYPFATYGTGIALILSGFILKRRVNQNRKKA